MQGGIGDDVAQKFYVDLHDGLYGEQIAKVTVGSNKLNLLVST